MSFRSASPALAAALLFGASTPAAKLLIGEMSPLILAGLLYLGSGIGLGVFIALRIARTSGARARATLRIPRSDAPWLLGAIVSGGVFAPSLLMIGLIRTSAAAASLLLNVEGVLTAVLAWVVFRENADRRIVLGMLAIATGGALLSWEPASSTFSPGALLIVAACFFWALDNNLTRRVATNDAMLIACVKGVLAGACNTSLGLAGGAQLPDLPSLLSSLIVGFLGYGLSLTLFVIGLRTLGTARTGAYFAVAPLFGVVLSLLVWPELPGFTFWGAAALMAVGVWMHLHERHEHEHSHESLVHAHSHRHDRHHRHRHELPWEGEEPHAHLHRHAALTHTHPHYPDDHHRHRH